MRDAFGTVLVVVVVLSTVAALWAAVGAGAAFRQLGKGALSLEEPSPRSSGAAAGSTRERDEEIRQLLEARNDRRAARGQAPIDVEAELARLTAPAVDPGLEAEVRQLVEARNARRERAGQPPLDVEGEVARMLRELP